AKISPDCLAALLVARTRTRMIRARRPRRNGSPRSRLASGRRRRRVPMHPRSCHL
ncbi:hypothetical protein HK405_011627, partial [Cladochytrium tenue]